MRFMPLRLDPNEAHGIPTNLNDILETKAGLEVGLMLQNYGKRRNFFGEEVDRVNGLAEVDVAENERVAVKLQILKRTLMFPLSCCSA